jgi:hypothetical protein
MTVMYRAHRHSARKLVWLSVLTICVCCSLKAAVATAAPVTEVLAVADTTVVPGGTLAYVVTVTNVGNEATPDSNEDGLADAPRVLTVTFPVGVTAAKWRGFEWECEGNGAGPDPEHVVGASVLTCTDPNVSNPYSSGTRNKYLKFETNVGSGVKGALTTHFDVVGGGAAQAATTSTTTVSPNPPGFGISAFDGQISGPTGSPYTQAGGVPYEYSTYIHYNIYDNPNPARGDQWPVEPPKDLIVNLPPGLLGNGNATSGVRCNLAQLANSINGIPFSQCPTGSQVGVVKVLLGGGAIADNPAPVYLMEPPVGVPVSLGFNIEGTPVTMNAKLRNGSDYKVYAEVHDISEGLPFLSSDITLWGVPADPSHDALRSCPGELPVGWGGPACTTNLPEVAFLRNPTSCTAAGHGLETTIDTDSWTNPSNVVSASFVSHDLPSFPAPADEWGAPVGTTGCADVPFNPSIAVQPTTNSAESPSGLNISLLVPQSWESPGTTMTSDLKDTKVALPVGYTVNPSAGAGLGVCTPEQLALETASSSPGDGCPSESKIGTVEVETPVLSEKLGGSIYLAKPFDNPFNSLLALYIVVKNAERGIVIKLSGRIDPDPVTGRLVTTFDDNPQVPFSRFTLKLRQGATSPLVSPPACGPYTAEADMTPWSAPSSAHHTTSSLDIEKGIGGGACPSGGVPPFKPGLVAGTLNNNAGSYSPLDIRITRNDGEQEITRFSSILPAGLSAKLTGVPFCPDADIEAAKHASGAQEEASPSCPVASEIGSSLVGAGVGSVLAWAPGKVYMAGPYNGAPFSIVAITSAKVGPFDLGTVVVREALKIDPVTAVVTADATASDPIPHIIDGIVVHVRDIRVHVDRPEFMINPTSCKPMSLVATVDGAGADPANPADQSPVTVDGSFQVANCQNLAFKPTFKASTSGKTSRSKGASLSVKLTYPKAAQGTQANIRSVKVDLPKQLPSRLTTLQKPCPDSVFDQNPAACPAASIVGHAKAITPIIPVPLVGPAYFVSHGGAKFPELVIVLQGYGVTLTLHGETFISKAGITSSTFRTVPDDPIGSFELTLPQGPNSALAANGNLCKRKLAMPTAFTAQNGQAIHRSTPISVTGCPKHKAKKKHKESRGKRGNRR